MPVLRMNGDVSQVSSNRAKDSKTDALLGESCSLVPADRHVLEINAKSAARMPVHKGRKSAQVQTLFCVTKEAMAVLRG
tara:strand:+ start:1727 stop:1963 length:237 start_codon:yes stop_codon:yes gene_type:complete